MKYIIKNTVGIPNINGLIFPTEEIQKYINGCKFPILCGLDKGNAYSPATVNSDNVMIKINSLQIENQNLIADIEYFPQFENILQNLNYLQKAQYCTDLFKMVAYGKINENSTIFDISYIGVDIDLNVIK